jgi:hypothetical protein
MKIEENDVQKVRNHADSKAEMSGPDVKHRIFWKKKNGKYGKFDFSAHLAPENILAIEVEDGVLRVTCQAYGAFFT